MATTENPDAHPVERMLALSDVLTTPRYAQLYARALELESPTVEELAAGIESSTTTVYDDVSHLREIGILERVTDTQPHRYEAQELELTIQVGDEEAQISPSLLVALAEAETNENIRLYLDRHGTAGLATALAYARQYVRGRVSAQIMAREEDIPAVEAETVLQELREVLLMVDPDAAESVDIDELDAVVDDMTEE